MKISLSDAFTGIMAVCALTVTALVVKNELTPTSPSAQPRTISDWRPLAQSGIVMGEASDPPVRIVEFSDFQCPFCGRVQAALREIRQRYPEDVSVVFRHLPLESIHPHAFAAAEASACADEQGRFEPYHDALFAAQDSIGRVPWERFAAAAGVPDVRTFSACIDERRHAGAVRADIAAAERIGARMTPTLVINDRMLPGAITLDELEREVERALGRARAREVSQGP